jgi:hypothetical protein
MALIFLLMVVQIWLLSAALESFLAGHTETALPAAIFSGGTFPELRGVDCVCFGDRPQLPGLSV